MSLDRIVKDRSATLYKTFYAGATPSDPTGSPTVALVRQSDGTTVTTGAVTDEAGTGTWSVTIPATSNTQLDRYTVTWSAVVNSVTQQYVDYVEVAGDHLFTIAEARTIRPLDNTTTYPEANIAAMRNRVEEALEDACGVAFVPRYAIETIPCDYPLMVSNPRVRVVRSATDGTTPLTQDQLDDLTVTGRTIYGLPWVPYNYSTWSGARFNVTVGYEHGYAYAPERVRRAALLLAKSWLVSGPIDDRAATFNAGADGGTYSLQTPGVRGSIFGLPEVDVVVQEYGYRVTTP